MAVAWQHHSLNDSSLYTDAPSLATYNWPLRITLLAVSISCVLSTLAMIVYVYRHRKMKVFKVANPIFLEITLLGCAIMYLEMAAVFPIPDFYSCIASMWTHHLGYCITYAGLLMKTWRVFSMNGVNSAHTDKQLFQWTFLVLLIRLIYLGYWTLKSPPTVETIRDQQGLIFNQCSYNMWDHSLAIGDVIILSWICLYMRNAVPLFNEARLISYAIYNIVAVKTAMVAFHVLIFPRINPDMTFLIDFVRNQLITSVTLGLIFGSKVVLAIGGQKDQYEYTARSLCVTSSMVMAFLGKRLIPLKRKEN